MSEMNEMELDQNQEVVTTTDNGEITETGLSTETTTETSSASGKGLGLVLVGSVLALGGLAAASIKAIKNKADKPKKPKMKLKLVRVPVEDDIDDVIDTDFCEEEPDIEADDYEAEE